MLTDFKSFVKNHQSDIFLTISVVLVALISFGIGYLMAPKTNQKPIIFHEAPASIQQAVQEKEDVQKEGKFVGSINSNKYHWPDCPWAKKISSENQIWFSSEKEAQEAGYIRCGSFEKYQP